MKAYLAYNGQKSGEEKLFDTMEKAKAWLLESILKTAGDDGEGEDWDGWCWWTTKDGIECFGGDEKDVWEGYVKEFTIE
jgi:hypothetical protein